MKIAKSAALTSVLMLLGCGALCAPAYAQFGPATPPRLRIPLLAPERARNLSLVSYPVAPFIAKGYAAETLFGGLIAFEAGFVPENRNTSYALGAWYWSSGATDLFEFHGKYYFRSNLGVQLGVLGSRNAGGAAWDAFLIYNIAAADRTRRSWDIQLGAGLFYDPTGGTTTEDFTGFVQGSHAISTSFSLDASYWFVHNRGTDFHRLAAGLGYRF